MQDFKSEIRLLLIVAAVSAVLAVAGILLLAGNTAFSPPPPVIQETPTKENDSSGWGYFEFSNTYNLKIPVPPKWTVNCCGDTGSFSAHTVHPLNSLLDESYAVVYDFALRGCPEGGFSCAIDETTTLSSDHFLEEMQKEINRTGEFLRIGGWSNLEYMGQVAIPRFGVMSTHYRGFGVDEGKIPIELYLFDARGKVYAIVFVKPGELGSDFIKEFLERVSPTWQTYRSDTQGSLIEELTFEMKYPEGFELENNERDYDLTISRASEYSPSWNFVTVFDPGSVRKSEISYESYITWRDQFSVAFAKGRTAREFAEYEYNYNKDYGGVIGTPKYISVGDFQETRIGNYDAYTFRCESHCSVMSWLGVLSIGSPHRAIYLQKEDFVFVFFVTEKPVFDQILSTFRFTP